MLILNPTTTEAKPLQTDPNPTATKTKPLQNSIINKQNE
jgi:hypothetical protein